MKRKYVYAVSWGVLFKFSERNWRNFCKVSSLQDANPADYGVIVSSVHEVTSWSQDQFKDHVS